MCETKKVTVIVAPMRGSTYYHFCSTPLQGNPGEGDDPWFRLFNALNRPIDEAAEMLVSEGIASEVVSIKEKAVNGQSVDYAIEYIPA